MGSNLSVHLHVTPLEISNTEDSRALVRAFYIQTNLSPTHIMSLRHLNSKLANFLDRVITFNY